MRNLTVHRQKSFVGCFQSYQIYIEDPVSPELEINGKPCRKLGSIKNGKQQTFSIGNEAVRIYAIADKLSKDYCNDFYDIPAGEENVTVLGKSHYNPMAGNPFYFQKELDEETKKSRQKGKKKGSVVMVIAVFVGLVLGFTITSLETAAKPETFRHGGMQITLTDEFTPMEHPQFTICYDSRNVAVMVSQTPFSQDGLDALSVEEYGDLLIENSGYDATLQTQDSLTYFEYTWENPDSGVEYNYFCSIYKTGDAFWLIQFSTASDQLDQYRSDMVKWAKSVTFSNEI